jgi:hypothetical protein
MNASAKTHPETIRLEPAAGFDPRRLQASRREKCLGLALCLAALAAGVSAGLLLRAAAARAASLPERREEVASLSAADKDQLRRQYTRFTAMSAEQQDGLRDFNAQLTEAEDAEALSATLSRYHEWLRTISPSDRELLRSNGDPDSKAQRVEELSPLAHGEKACAKSRFPALTEEQLLPWGQGLLMERPGNRDSRRPFPKIRGLDEADFERLSASLSELRSAELSREETTGAKRRLVLTWLGRRRNPNESRLGPASTDDLVRFFTDDLTDEQRRRLIALPLDQRNRELRDEFRKSRPRGSAKR